jgi:sugar phosphate permease
MNDAGPAITRYDFSSGLFRGSHFTLYASCLVHRSDNHLETLPLAGIASLRVAYERDLRKLGWGVSLLVVALILFVISAPLAALASSAAAEMAAAGTHGVARALHGLFSFLWGVAKALPFIGLALALGGIALAVLGWLGATTLVLDLSGSERVYPVRGRNPGLLDFSEAISERLMSLKR